LWRVDGQDGNILYATAMDGLEEQHRFYLPLEQPTPGRLPLPAPECIGFPQAQELMLRAHRLSLLHGTAPFLSLQRSRVIPTNYQLVPVILALDQPRVRMLLADDVGLGKSIEAGLVITELMARGLARRLLIICPASLREQWRETLEYFFHIEARIMSARHRRGMEKELPVGANPWEFYSAFIVSVDYAKTPAIKNQILEVPWDIVVIDEAHQVAKPHQTGPDHKVRMDRWELAKAIASSPKVRHLLLLTATPHNGYTDSFASLLGLLDVDAVSGPEHNPNIRREIAKHHVVQRRRKDVEEWFRREGRESVFPERDQDEVVIQPSDVERSVIQEVERYGELVLEHAQDAPVPIRILARWTVLHLHKRALSSPEALRRSLRNRREGLLRRLKGLAEEDVGLPPEVARANVLDEDTGERLDSEEAGQRAERLAVGEQAALEAELRALDELMAKAKKVTPKKDAKLQHLLKNLLRERLRYHPKVIIFTRYRDTMEYVTKQIKKSRRYTDTQVITLHGGLNERQRRERFLEFERAAKAVIVATDAISEGINLQHACCQIIHYELPWNPNRLEQRNGRVDRFGQREPKVIIRTLVMDETLDAAILKVLVEKARRIREDYGFAPPYFGDEANILELIREHGLKIRPKPRQLSFFENVVAARPEVKDPFSPEVLERIQEESFYGQTNIRLPDIERRLRETWEAVGSPEEVRAFMISALNRFGCSVSENGDGTLRIVLTRPDLRLPGVGEVIERVTFDPKIGLEDPDVTVLDLGHPLVRRLIDVVKREAFREGEYHGRTAVVVTPDVKEVTAVYHVLARYVVHTEPPHIIEELFLVAMPVYGDGILDPEATRHLLQARLSPRTLTDAEAQEVLADALNRPDLETLLSVQVEARRQTLAQERRELRERLAEGAGEAARRLEGIDELTIGSWDLLAVKVWWPE